MVGRELRGPGREPAGPPVVRGVAHGVGLRRVVLVGSAVAAPRQAVRVGAHLTLVGVVAGGGTPALRVVLLESVVGVVGVGRGLAHVVLPLRLGQQRLLQSKHHAVRDTMVQQKECGSSVHSIICLLPSFNQDIFS